MRPYLLIAVGIFFCFFGSPGTADAGNLVYYDEELSLYWSTKISDTTLTIEQANTWVQEELIDKCYGGVTNWQLPSTPSGSTWGYDPDENSTKYNVLLSDIGHLFYTILNLSAEMGYTDGEVQVAAASLGFTSLKAGPYWFGTPTVDDKYPEIQASWLFDFENGAQYKEGSAAKAYVIAVCPVHAPEPESLALFFLGSVFLFFRGFKDTRNRKIKLS